MKRFWYVIPALTLSLSAFGADRSVSFLDTLRATPTMDEVPAGNADECANFSGSWKGVCMSSGKKVEQAFALEQKDCNALAVKADEHKMFIPVGGELSIGGAIPGTPAMTFGTHIESHWNKEKSVLTVQVMGGGKALTIDGAPKGFALRENMKLKDGKLYVDIFAMGGEHKLVAFCEFEKQG